jgi:uncharacterized membrane protein
MIPGPAWCTRPGEERGEDMESTGIVVFLGRISRALLIIVIFAIAIPSLLGIVLAIPVARLYSLVFSTLILQATAVAVGLGAGLSPALVLAVMTSFAFGMVLAIYEILDTFYDQSERVRNWVDRIEVKAKKFTILDRYGIYSLIFLSWIPGLGLYACPVIAWMFRWEKVRAVLLITLGFFLASVGMMLGALGLVRIIT